MGFFRRRYEVSTNRIRDKIRVRENGNILDLKVNEEAGRLVYGLNKVQAKLAESKDQTAAQETAEYFAGVIFGDEQAAMLMDFYDNDPYSVIEVCGKYFSERLGAMITRAQKHETVR